MVQQPILGGYYDYPSNTATEFNTIAGGYPFSTTEANFIQVVPCNGILKNLYVRITTAPANSGSYTFTVRRGTVGGGAMTNTDLYCIIADPDTTGSNISTELSVSKGDRLSFACTPSADPAPTAFPRVRWTVDIITETGTYSIVMGCSQDAPTADTTEFIFPSCSGTPTWSTTESERVQVCPMNGTLRDLCVVVASAPGSSKTLTFTIRKNSGDTAVVTTISNTATEGNSGSNTESISIEDELSIKIESTSGSSMSRVYWGFVIEAANSGEFPIMMRNTTTPTASSFHRPNTWDDAYSTEATKRQLSGAFTIKAVYGILSAAPGSSNGRVFQLRDDGADVTGATLTFGATDTEKNVTGLSVAVEVESGICWYNTATGTPESCTYTLSILGYNETGGEEYSRSLTETSILSDTKIKIASLVRDKTEISIVNDSIAKINTILKVKNEMSSLSDSIEKINTLFRSESEISVLEDSILKYQGTIKSENISLEDSITKLNTFFRIKNENIVISDFLEKLNTLFRVKSESVVVDDNVDKTRNMNRTRTENVSLDDNIEKTDSFSREKTENIALSDNISKLNSFLRTETENIILADTITKINAKLKIFTETASITSTLVRISNFIKIISEIASIVDSLARTIPSGRAVDLYVEIYDETHDGWVRVGTTPHIDEIDFPLKYIYTATLNSESGYYTFNNTELDGNITASELQLYCKRPSATGSYVIEIYIDDGESEQLAGTITPDANFSWKALDIKTIIDTFTKVKATKVKFKAVSS